MNSKLETLNTKLQYISQARPTHVQTIHEAAEAGVPWVQLRVKNTEFASWLITAKACRDICNKFNIPLIINDNIEIAILSKADGVHLGKQDASPSEARAILGEEAIIGGTANTFEDIQYLVSQGVDYVGLGPFRFTNTKDNLSPILGLEGYSKIINQCKEVGIEIPIIAIGGILVENIPAILSTGIHGVAIASLINEAKNKKEVVSEILKSLDNN